MKELLFAVMAVSLVSAAVSMLSPEGGGTVNQQVRFAASLAVCAALMVPLLAVLREDLPSFSLTAPEVTGIDPTEAQATILHQGTRALCRELEAQVMSRFDVENASLELSLDSNDLSAVKILGGVLCGKGQVKKAASYLSDLLGCDIEAEETTDGDS